MRPFVLTLLTGEEEEERFDDATSLVAEDETGSFGILAGHAPFLTVLEPGLVRLHRRDGDALFLAVPGGLLRVAAGRVVLVARRCFRGRDPHELARRLAEELARAALARAERRRRLERLEAEMLRRLVELEREHGP